MTLSSSLILPISCIYSHNASYSHNRSHPHLWDMYYVKLIPSILMTLLSPFYMTYVWKSKFVDIQINSFDFRSDRFVAKLAMIVFFVIVNVVDLEHTIKMCKKELADDFLIILSPLVTILSALISIGNVVAERRARLPGTPLNFVYYFVLATTSLADVISYTYDAFESEDPTYVRILTMENFITFVIFFLCCFREKYSSIPEDGCNISTASTLSRVTFYWLSKLMYSLYNEDLRRELIFDLTPDCKASVNYLQFRRQWERREKTIAAGASLRRLTYRASKENEMFFRSASQPAKKRNLPLIRILYCVIARNVALSWLFKLSETLLRFADPWILFELILFTSINDMAFMRGLFLSCAFLVLQLVRTVVKHQGIYFSLIGGMRQRSMLISAIYRKVLRMSNEARCRASQGDITGLVSIDVQKVCQMQESIWIIMSAVLSTSICIGCLWLLLGTSFLAGFGILLLFIPLCGLLIAFSQKLEETEIHYRDKRVNLLSEIFNAIEFLKMYSWEFLFEKRVKEARRDEISIIRKVNVLKVFVEILWILAPILVFVISLKLTLNKESKTLNAQTIFVTFNLLDIMGDQLADLPWAVSNLSDAIVSLDHLRRFFLVPDLDVYAKENLPKIAGRPAILVDHGSFTWNADTEIILYDIDFKVNEGRLVAIIGHVGCGKSSLLSAVIGEMQKTHGYVGTRGTIAYVPQTPWLQQKSIRDNILCDEDMDEEFYNQVITDCCLHPDLKTLDLGDMTLIGEGGVTLTNGQKHRINLARAVYQNSDIYLLDDPLSSVDVLVAQELFTNVIGNIGCLKGKTRLFVTHGLRWLPYMDFILVIKNGTIAERGSYNDLWSRPHSVLRDLFSENAMDADFSTTMDSTSGFSSESNSDIFRFARRTTIISRGRSNSFVKSFSEMRSESVPMASPKLSVLKNIYQIRGWPLSSFVVLSCLALTTADVLSGCYLSVWSDDPLLRNVTHPNFHSGNNAYLVKYVFLEGVKIFSAFSFNIVDSWASTLSSRVFHANMLATMIRAPISVFALNPIGRILNRFSADIGIVDHELPEILNEALKSFFAVIASVIIICVQTPFFLFVVLPLLVFYMCIQSFYGPIMRQSRRLEAVTQSPIFNFLKDTVTGAPIIRSSARTRSMATRCDELTDENALYYYFKVVSHCWLSFRLDLIAGLVVFSAMVVSIFSRNRLTAGQIGLSITYALHVTEKLSCLVCQITEFKSKGVAVERIIEYSEGEREDFDINARMFPADSWPQEGHIVFKDVSCSYRHGLNQVLTEVNFEILPGEIVSVVGRTGYGKSSVIQALFRLIDLKSGSICVDNVNIQSIGLSDLRSRITVLPENPILFSGTLRYNLDPFEQFDDAVLWDVLSKIEICDWVLSHPEKLLLQISEFGRNLSGGQKALICIARIMLHTSKILVLDQLGASLSLEMSRRVTDAILDNFPDSTVLMITNQMTDIMETDKVVVLDRGRVCECDSPIKLLKNKHGLFYAMASEAGIKKPPRLHF